MNPNNPYVHPCLAKPSPKQESTAIILLSLAIVAIGAIKPPVIWLTNLTAIPVLLVTLVRFPWHLPPEEALRRTDLVYLRITLYAAWTGALVHHVLYG